MPVAFVDTVAWIALVNTRDSLHERAKQVFARLRADNYRFVTTEFVLLEFANALSAPAFRAKAATFIRGLRNLPEVETVGASAELFAAGFALYQNRSDKEWSLVDCSSFVVTQKRGIAEAFTSDHHFVRAGFVILL